MNTEGSDYQIPEQLFWEAPPIQLKLEMDFNADGPENQFFQPETDVEHTGQGEAKNKRNKILELFIGSEYGAKRQSFSNILDFRSKSIQKSKEFEVPIHSTDKALHLGGESHPKKAAIRHRGVAEINIWEEIPPDLNEGMNENIEIFNNGRDHLPLFPMQEANLRIDYQL
eukprot:TRINITY_DN6970_c0_g1_i2.p1 TRINITY_DN6970_c0_g1~~TRINITY_DN6970_c0_g1_i2.p1  ORF type:complete len:170 (+),score=28.01 TRINITY_DN6970_c0_g1_i2:114-623(+)